MPRCWEGVNMSNGNKKDDAVYLPQLIGLIAFVLTSIADKFIIKMPEWLYITLSVAALISMGAGVLINLKRKYKQ